MARTGALSRIFFLLLLASGGAYAQVTSTFDTDGDNWTALNGSVGDPQYFSTGGNPGEFASFTYASNTSSTPQHWVAPAKFLGNQVVRSLGMTFSFSLQQSQAATKKILSFFIVALKN